MEIVKPLWTETVFGNHTGILLTDDSQFVTIARDPAAPLFNTERTKSSLYPPEASLIDLLDRAVKHGARRVMVSYDFFFGGNARTLNLDSPETLAAYEVIARLAKERGLGLEGSIINPLDLGRGYAAKHAQAGEMCLFQEGRIAADGAYAMTLKSQVQWNNNKGPINLAVKAVKVFAFAERRVPGTTYFAVDPAAIRDISDTVTHAAPAGAVSDPRITWRQQPYRVEGRWAGAGKGMRCLVVLIHTLPDLDYFAPAARAYAHGVIDEYHRRGVDFDAFYGDEMHSQFDWELARVGAKELQVRYLTPSMCAAFAQAYGAEYADLYKYLVYFAQGHSCLDGPQLIDGAQHVMAATAEGINRTRRFRRDYFDMLSNAVTGLSLDAKRYAEKLYGHAVEVTAHPTWQESPTCDNYGLGDVFENPRLSYDYSDKFEGSASVREAISACYNYFHWNRVYTGCGTDHPECGWADRDYFGRAFACSLGTLNDTPWAYCAHWGSPREVSQRVNQVTAAYGCRNSSYLHNVVQGQTHRDTDVLLLYPLDLLYADQRFGSWMVQYGYCNYATEEDFCRWARVGADGRVSLRGRKYRVVGALFEPLVRPRTLELLSAMLERGGSVLWMSAPPQTYEAAATGTPLARWQKMFGVKFERPPAGGAPAGHKVVKFCGALASAEKMEIPSNLPPDWVYPVTPAGAVQIARLGAKIVGTLKTYKGGGRALFLGFRARDDQSASTGADLHTLFDALCAVGAYAGEDHPERISRLGPMLANRFPNGVVTITNHFRSLPEQWPGGFARNAKEDAEIVPRLNLPPNRVQLQDFKVDGHSVTYDGAEVLSYAVQDGRLAAFCGNDTTGITVDGRQYELSSQPVTLAWAPVARAEWGAGVRAALRLWVSAPGAIRLPVDARRWQAVRGSDANVKDGAAPVTVRREGDGIIVEVAAGQANRWLFLGDW